ncbi:MAG: CRISPR-associated protein Cas4 [Verrucomicrobiales bacterium]|nr:CRISPR-associated protein Cas4 [Verrucomicrobiales bacterium]
MSDQDPSASSENRLSDQESSLKPRGLSPGTSRSRSGDNRQRRESTTEPKQLKIVVRVAPVQPNEPTTEEVETPASPALKAPPDEEAKLAAKSRPETAGQKVRAEAEPQQIPARMLNEFVYCQRLFYYEFVEGVFVENADTMRGGAIHRRVDTGSGALPKAKGRSDVDKSKGEEKAAGTEPYGGEGESETIHSRSVQMGSERLGVVAKMDLVEARAARANEAEKEDLFTALEVCPVDYKAGAPKEGQEANELWDTDKMQLGLQALILRDNGYTCNEGIIYYRATKQRVRLAITPELESWILQNIGEAKRVARGPIPVPLVNSPKCVRCSLAPVCLPDETRMFSTVSGQSCAQPIATDNEERERSQSGHIS